MFTKGYPHQQWYKSGTLHQTKGPSCRPAGSPAKCQHHLGWCLASPPKRARPAMDYKEACLQQRSPAARVSVVNYKKNMLRPNIEWNGAGKPTDDESLPKISCRSSPKATHIHGLNPQGLLNTTMLTWKFNWSLHPGTERYPWYPSSFTLWRAFMDPKKVVQQVVIHSVHGCVWKWNIEHSPNIAVL